MRALFKNPILAREIDHRMRDNRTYFVPLIYVSVLALVAIGVYLAMTWTANAAPAGSVQGWEIGKAIFHAVAFVQMGLVVLLVPSVSAAAITAERDKGTLVPLLVTPLPRGQIAVGKLLAPILYVLLLVSTSIPFAALSFGFGGTGPALLASTYACLLTTVLMLSALGLLISSLLRRTVPAVLLAYGMVMAVVVGTGIGDLILNLARENNETIFFLYLNPFTPLVLQMQDCFTPYETSVTWWITPLLQLGLTALLALIAARRISFLRE